MQKIYTGEVSNWKDVGGPNLQQTVAVTKEAIGYVSLGSLDPQTVMALKINNVECAEANILAHKYIIQRPFLTLTKTAFYANLGSVIPAPTSFQE